MNRSSFLIGGIAATAFATLVVGRVIPGVPTPVAWVLRIATLISAIIFHEVAHGLAAEKLGDPTARRMGRLTLNPIPHIDIMGSIIIPGFLLISGSSFVIGWAKPVPVDIRRFENPLRDWAITALAGPAANGLQLAVYVALFRFAESAGLPTWVGFLAFSGAAINLFLGLFNLIPIPPLDGSRIVAAMLPPEMVRQYLSIERFGFIIIFGLLWLNVLDPLFNLIWKLLLTLLF
ncbi:site-2 protease family protein [bacterium]|nr:site-2 protease family protein [bacterium]